MYARWNLLIGDPAKIDEVTRYVEENVRRELEAQPGSRGMAMMTDREQGQAVVASYWDSAEALTTSEHAVQTSRKEAAELAGGSITVEQYEVPIFVRNSRPERGAGVRITVLHADPGELDSALRAFQETAVPGLRNMSGLASAQALVNRDMGQYMVVAAFESQEALVASRAEVARLRAETLGKTHVKVLAVQEFTLEFTTVREDESATS
jgi:heme-degrading monooxygenase HmoA